MAKWQEEAERLHKQGKNWMDIAQQVAYLFPGQNIYTVKERCRSYLRRRKMGSVAVANDTQEPEQETVPETPSSVEYFEDGRRTYQEIVSVMNGGEVTPDMIMKAHGLDPDLWTVLSLRNNFWNAQLKGGNKIIMYQSRLTVKPKTEGLILDAIRKYFSDEHYPTLFDPIINTCYSATGEVLEICLPDLHGGLLAWRLETGSDYDIAICKERFFSCIADIVQKCENRKFKKIVFVTLGDVLHVDNDDQKTTKGTPQQVDGRLYKIVFNIMNMLIEAIGMFSEIAPTEVIYVSGNHDLITGYMLLMAVEKAFSANGNVSFDVLPDPQKHRQFGNVLVGWTHGDMPKKNMPFWLQQKARKEFGDTLFAEIHAGHYHSQDSIEFRPTLENAGVVVRYLPAICSSSSWEHREGFPKTVKTVVSFVWNENTGLREMWFSNV